MNERLNQTNVATRTKKALFAGLLFVFCAAGCGGKKTAQNEFQQKIENAKKLQGSGTGSAYSGTYVIHYTGVKATFQDEETKKKYSAKIPEGGTENYSCTQNNGQFNCKFDKDSFSGVINSDGTLVLHDDIELTEDGKKLYGGYLMEGKFTSKDEAAGTVNMKIFYANKEMGSVEANWTAKRTQPETGAKVEKTNTAALSLVLSADSEASSERNYLASELKYKSEKDGFSVTGKDVAIQVNDTRARASVTIGKSKFEDCTCEESQKLNRAAVTIDCRNEKGQSVQGTVLRPTE